MEGEQYVKPISMSTWLHNTPKQYVKVLALFYFVIKGMGATILLFGSFPYYFYYFGVTGIEYQAYTTIQLLPWGCKSIIGILTDGHPIYGYHKRWYAYIATGMLPLWLVGVVASNSPDVFAVMMTGASTSLMTLDALMEGQYMSNVRFHNSDKGTASFTWQCVMSGSIVGLVIIGLCAKGPEDAANIRYAFITTLVLSFPFVYLVFRNPATLFPDDVVRTELNTPMMYEMEGTNDDDTKAAVGIRRSASGNARRPSVSERTLAFLLLAGSITMFVLLFIDAPVAAFCGALLFTILLVLMLNITYADDEGLRHTCLFGFLNEALHLNISGAMDTYYTTQNDNCLITGPKFDFLFYITVAGVVSGIVGTSMAWLYRKQLIRRFQVRSTVIAAIIAWGCTSIADIIIIRKWNESVLNTPAWIVFIFGDVVFSQAMSMIILLPLMSLTSTAVIDGVATLTSMNTLSCQNIGASVGRVFGIYLTYILGVHSTDDNGCNFDNLVPLVIVARMVIPLLTVSLCYSLLPNAILEQAKQR